jgi:hypothetical protein
MSWASIQNALHTVLTDVLQLDASAVLWEGYGAPEPTGAYATLVFGALRPVGHQWQRITADGDAYVENLARPYEIDLTVSVLGEVDGQDRLATAIDSLALSGHVATLDAVGISVLRPGPIQNLSVFVVPGFEGRAQCVLTLGLTRDVESSLGVIATAAVIGSTGE